jgi:hypothetical protein
MKSPCRRANRRESTLKQIDQDLDAANIDIQTTTILDQSDYIQESRGPVSAAGVAALHRFGPELTAAPPSPASLSPVWQ